MKKRLQLSIFIFLVFYTVASAQEYGNEWINPSQKYYKISTADDGIYRITYNELVNVGFPVSAIDPRNIQLFHRGEEMAISIPGQPDASFDTDDYIEFYGKKNDGTLDEELYVHPNAHKRKYYNFYSDTTAYFLTWSLTETGKRILPFKENNVLNLPAENYHLNEETQLFTQQYAYGLRYPEGGIIADTYLSAFDYGEGWTGEFFGKNQFRDITFSGLENIVTTGPKPILEILLTGGNNNSHQVSISVGPDQGSLRSLKDVSFHYMRDTLIIDTLEWSDISNGNLLCRVFIPDNGVSERLAISHGKLQFANSWDQQSLEQKFYYVKPTNSNRSYIEISNVPSGAQLYDITDEANIIKIECNRTGQEIDAVIPNDINGRKLLITDQPISVPKIQSVSMREIVPMQADYLMVTNKVLRKSTDNYSDGPKAYAAYRASNEGGSFDTLLINVDELYNIFSYGEYTSLALYRFCRFMADGGDPKYLFIIGKGLSGPNLLSYRIDGSLPSRDLVPTAGFPGTDVLYSAGLNGSTYEAGFPVGRIAAETPQAVDAYFEKVKEMEATPNDAHWRKELVHLSGGKTTSEQNRFLRYVNTYKAIAEGPFLGGAVETISKTSSGATTEINIAEQVNDGKALVTFFGHSGAVGTDIFIGYVSEPSNNYNNKGKYPMLLVNGCNAGDMYRDSDELGFGEDWILNPDKGAIGFIAHTNSGITSYLSRYTNKFYNVAFADSLSITKGIGDIQKEVGKRYIDELLLIGYTVDNLQKQDIGQVQQMALHGDPAVSLFGVNQPDYEVNPDNVFVLSIDGEPVNAHTEMFNLGIITSNFGATHNDSIKVTVNRTVSSGAEFVLDTMVYKSVYYLDTLYFPIKSIGIDGFGLNQFTIKIDPLNEVDELNEMNNEAVFEHFLPLGGAQCTYPSRYAIVNQNNVKLISQSLDLLMEDRMYFFELDTTRSFNSPYRKQNSIQADAYATWSVDIFENLQHKDTIVFYWRSKFASARPEELDTWHISSFTYVNNGQSGWAMAHFQQLEGNEKNNITINEDARILEFEKHETSLDVRTFGKFNTDFDITNTELIVNNTNYLLPTDPWICDDNAMTLMSFSKSSTVPYLVLGTTGVSDPLSCGITPQSVNTLTNSRIQNNLMIEQYINQMGDGDFVVMFSVGNVTYQSWPASTFTKLEEIGVNLSDIQSLLDGEPVIIYGRKGANVGSATVVTADYTSPAPATEQEIFLEDVVVGQLESGSLVSPKIGPATSWISFHQKVGYSEDPTSDEFSFKIIGISPQDVETVLFEDVTAQVLNLDQISVTSYPFLRLEIETSDPTNLTPTQLKNWFVIYEGVPEGILSYTKGQQTDGIELSEGQEYQASFTFNNISNLAFQDSILVEYNIYNQPGRKSNLDTLMLKPLDAEESIDFSLELETMDKIGLNDLKVFANPHIQQEQNFNNNFINLTDYLNVTGDNTNPIMEVTVDGEFIMDGDIVSPSPIILMRLKDENTTLLKEDTLGVHLYLNEQCNGCEPTRVNFSSSYLIWTPATEESDFTIEYQPQTLADGVYTLQAQAADASGNQAGTEPYSVNFEIVNESQITNFFPYPNPFSTRTQFVFTLTGSEIPDEIIIQIMTVNGTVVREITQDEMGPIKIGHNKTEYAWDGRDEFGDQLANGVYLYKVKIFTNGNEMQHRSTSADHAFKNGVGKIYLLK